MIGSHGNRGGNASSKNQNSGEWQKPKFFKQGFSETPLYDKDPDTDYKKWCAFHHHGYHDTQHCNYPCTNRVKKLTGLKQFPGFNTNEEWLKIRSGFKIK